MSEYQRGLKEAYENCARFAHERSHLRTAPQEIVEYANEMAESCVVDLTPSDDLMEIAEHAKVTLRQARPDGQSPCRSCEMLAKDVLRLVAVVQETRGVVDKANEIHKELRVTNENLRLNIKTQEAYIEGFKQGVEKGKKMWYRRGTEPPDPIPCEGPDEGDRFNAMGHGE